MADKPARADDAINEPRGSLDLAGTRADMPLPQDLQSFVLIGIFSLLILCAFYFAREIVLPIVVAFVLYLLLQPSMRTFARLHVP